MHEDITKISIKEYLEGMGIPTRKEGARHFASSPFSTDSNWSFVIYPTNTYFDFSTGQGEIFLIWLVVLGISVYEMLHMS